MHDCGDRSQPPGNLCVRALRLLRSDRVKAAAGRPLSSRCRRRDHQPAVSRGPLARRSIGMPDDIQIYCNCVERVRYHVGVADTVFAGRIDTGQQDLNVELIFLHLRKALEEIAFATLSANREKYSQARAGFATEWNARRMLGFIEKVNANFYPIPLMPPREIAPGRKHFDRVTGGYLTKDDFATLYDGSAEVMHCCNPYAPGNPTINVQHTVDEW